MSYCAVCETTFRSPQQLGQHRRQGCVPPIRPHPPIRVRHRLFELRRWETGWAAVCMCGLGATGPTVEDAKTAFASHLEVR